MLKRLFSLLALLVFGMLLAGCDTGSTAPPTPAPKTPVKESGSVVSEGTVVPVRWAELGYSAGGTVSDVLVTEGATVKAGQTLVRLDSRRLMQAVNQAESGFMRAQAGQARAQAAVARYEAALALLKAGPRAEDVAMAAAAVGVAQAQLAKAQAGADTTALAQAKATMDKAARAVQQAQATYDRVKDTPFGNIGPDALRLEQTTIEYDAAKTTYEQLVLGPRDTDINVVKAQLAQAGAALTQAQTPARPESIAAAEADLKAAQADAQGVTADVASAEAALVQARIALADAELKAPFDGTIVTLNNKVGELATSGVFVVRLADLSALRIETTDLTELSVSRIRAGDAATITFDALPGVKLAGRVTRIDEYGRNRQGDIVYTVYVLPDTPDNRLRWNMTASVNISAGPID